MRLLLDTHVYLWWLSEDRLLPKVAYPLIQEATEVYISSASIWEASIKVKLGKLEANIDELVSAIDESGFLELPVTAKHAARVSSLPNLHRDPFDRILIAQALSEPLKFITADSLLKQYSELIEII